jgi:uncharacterized protein YcgI (DUF1989 family)
MAIDAVTGDPVVVPGGTGWAAVAKAGSAVVIFDVDGKQVGDLVLFRATIRPCLANLRGAFEPWNIPE